MAGIPRRCHQQHVPAAEDTWPRKSFASSVPTRQKPQTANSYGIAPVQKVVTEKSENEEWEKKFGKEAQQAIRDCVDANVAHYEYLKSFAVKI